MPIYEYQCSACNHRFETLHQRSDEAPPPCSRCGDPAVARLLSAFAVATSRPEPPPGSCGTSECACRSS